MRVPYRFDKRMFEYSVLYMMYMEYKYHFYQTNCELRLLWLAPETRGLETRRGRERDVPWTWRLADVEQVPLSFGAADKPHVGDMHVVLSDWSQTSREIIGIFKVIHS